METTLVTCVICPKGCSISVDWEEDGDKKVVREVKNNSCPRGYNYASSEVVHPERVLTTTIRVENGTLSYLPIRSRVAIPKETLLLAMDEIRKMVIQAPVKMGDVIIKNILNTGVDMIASRSTEIKS